MLISFYEEFPTRENLQKLRLCAFPTKLYLAARSLEGFKRVKAEALAIKEDLQDVIYWPVLQKREGYWLSPWSERTALLRVIEEIEREGNLGIMWDAEVPRGSLYPRMDFVANYRLIRRFFKTAPQKGIRIFASELYLGRWAEGLLKMAELSFDPRTYDNWKILMLYSSIFGDKWGSVSQFIIRVGNMGVRRYGERFILALGVIATGVGGNEPLLSPEELRRDLQSACSSGIREAIVFRLGGLDTAYLKAMEGFV